MIRVHHLEKSRSLRVLWLLEELGAPYEIVRHKRDAKTFLAPPELRKIHPLGKAPIVEHDGRVIAETAVIVEYLATLHDSPLLLPADNDNYWRLRYWMHYAEGSLMPPLLLKLVVDRLGPLGWPVRKLVRRQIDVHLDFLETEAGRDTWMAGPHFSAADIMMSFPLEVSRIRGGLGPSRPNLAGLLDRMHERPAYRRAVERGGV